MPPTLFNASSFVVVTGTTSATANTTTTHAHQGGTTPRCYVILQRGNGVVYEAAAPDATNLSMRGSVASLPFTAIVFF